MRGSKPACTMEVYNTRGLGYSRLPNASKAYGAQRVSPSELAGLQESTLGVAFRTGGIDMALRAGDALGMSMGGPLPWSLRYSRPPEPSLILPPIFSDLQASMGYEFHRGELLIEAITHPSFTTSAGSSYQRLELLGDGEVDPRDSPSQYSL